MKNLLLYLLSFFIVLPLVAQKASPPNDNAFNTVNYRSIAPLRINGEQGVSAPFVGTIGKSVLVAGGCNFPTTPAAQGGKKQFYADIYELTNIEKSMMELRTRLVLYHHEKSLNELSFSAMTGGPIYDLANKMVIAIDKGIGALDKGLDHAAVQIKHSGQGEVNATESSYKNFDYGLHGLQVPGLKLPDQSQGNAAIAESLTAFIAEQKGVLLGADGIKSKVEVDKLNANLMELAEKLKMLNGRVEKDAERIRKRLEKLAQDNQAGKETTQDKEIQDQRESIKTLLDGINHEFQAFSKDRKSVV